MAIRRQQMKNAMLPVAMLLGVVCYKWIGELLFISPYLIFLMLFITYCRLEPKDIKPGKQHIFLLLIQMCLATVIYFILLPVSHTVAEGIFICVYVPTATAAPVITSMLGGSITFVATYSLISNGLVGITGAAVLAAIGDTSTMDFWTSTGNIILKVFPLLIGPLILALLVQKISPSFHDKISKSQSISFYLWAVSLLIIVGCCVSFLINHWDEDQLPTLGMLVVGALIVCIIQFTIGRSYGKMLRGKINRLEKGWYHDSEKDYDMRVATAQSLMQKNTVLAVWMAMVYMTPLASVAPAAYIAWQNIVNSWQIMKKE